MRAYPDIRGAKPRKWFWLANFIPCVQVWAHEAHIGFWCQPHSGRYNPVMRRPFIAKTRFGWSIRGWRGIRWPRPRVLK